MAEALALDGVTAGYGETVVLEDVSRRARCGRERRVIGRNGVGKTTLLATVMGHTTLHRGHDRAQGPPHHALPDPRRARAGLGYVPQEREIFPSLTVRENLDRRRPGPGRWRSSACSSCSRAWPSGRQHGRQLSGGEQQMLAIARALMVNPDVLLHGRADRGPGAGDRPGRSSRRWIGCAPEEGWRSCWSSRTRRVALDFSERTVVMDRGRIVYRRPEPALQDDPKRLDLLIGVAG